MQKASKFPSALYFLRIFSYIMSYDFPMLFCIKVSICEPISIGYTVNSLIPDEKTAQA